MMVIKSLTSSQQSKQGLTSLANLIKGNKCVIFVDTKSTYILSFQDNNQTLKLFKKEIK